MLITFHDWGRNKEVLEWTDQDKISGKTGVEPDKEDSGRSGVNSVAIS